MIIVTCRFQNPDTPRAGRLGAHGGAAGRGRARLGANSTVRSGDKGPSCSQVIDKTKSERLSRSTNKRNLMSTEKGIKPAVDNRLIAVYPRFIRSVSAGREARFVPGCRLVNRRFFCLWEPFSCKACPGKDNQIGKTILHSVPDMLCMERV